MPIGKSSGPVEPGYTPQQLADKPGVVEDTFVRTPLGVILHGSRSGGPGTVSDAGRHAEFVGTADYAVDMPLGYGWNATIGDDEIAVHMAYDEWGWNARGASDDYLAVEFAQPTEAWPITNGQVRAFCWFFEQARRRWTELPMTFPTHAELDGTEIYGGHTDGKTDVFHKGSVWAEDLRRRIMAELGGTS